MISTSRTVADKIRSMTDDELATILFQAMHTNKKAINVNDMLDRLKRAANELNSIF